MASTFEKVGECLYRYKPTGMFYARFEVGGKEGKEFRRSLRTKDKPLARRRLLDLQRDLAHLDAEARKSTLLEYCERSIATARGQKPKTRYIKGLMVKTLERDLPGGATVPINRVKARAIEDWLARHNTRPVSYNSHLEFIQGVFDLALADRVLAVSPIAHLKRKKVSRPVRKTPTYEDFVAIVAEIRRMTNKPQEACEDSADFAEFLGLAGLGQAEAKALRWADVNWRSEQITTFRHKTATGFVIPIYPQLKPLLERLRQERGGNPPDDEKVFRRGEVRRAIAGACQRLGLPAYTHRSFRRMFITRAIERGVDVKVIAEWQGHRDGGKLILDTYSHVAPKHSARMAKLMSEEPK